MKRITLTCFLLSITFAIAAQTFYYKSNLSYGVSINDALELNGKFYLVGNIDSAGIDKPYFCIINNQGSMVFDTIFSSTGKFVNIHEVNSVLHISTYFNPFSGFYLVFDLQFDTNFVFQNAKHISPDINGVLQKSKFVNDSLIFYIGYEPPPAPNITYTSFVAKQNIFTGNVTYNYPSYSVNPMEVYDIISPSVGKYHLYLNSPDSLITEQLSVLYLNDSLQAYKSLQLNSSYSLFGSDSTIKGVAAAEYKSGIININCVADHPTYLNQTNRSDLALIQFDTNYSELSISFSGKPDTNYISSRNSIALGKNLIYSGGTGQNEEIIINSYDTLNNRLRYIFYHDASVIELKKILAFKDSLLILGNTNNQFFAIKMDSTLSYIRTSLDEKDRSQSVQFKVFPNPSKEFISINSGDILVKKVEIYNQNGSLVKTINRKSTNKINIENFNAGVYIIKLTTEQNLMQSIIFIKTE